MVLGFTTYRSTMKILFAILALFGCQLWAQYIPNEDCMECHDGKGVDHAYSHQPEMKVYCVSCHVASEEDYDTHLDSPDELLLPIPRGAVAFEVCSKCHEEKASTHTTHAQADLSCLDCHALHATDDEPLNPNFLRTETEMETCAKCHKGIMVALSKPFTHPMGEGGMECSSCHDVHSSDTESSLREAYPGQLVCYNCHTDKQGPFVFQHVNDFVGDCLTCHEMHGSSNRASLKRTRVYQLCLECHTPTDGLLGSLPPSRHEMNDPRYQNCTVCHISVHGSNRSPLLLK